VQDRLASSAANDLAVVATPAKSTKTADALAPMASVAAAPSQ
jgi:hypothetical protein